MLILALNKKNNGTSEAELVTDPGNPTTSEESRRSSQFLDVHAIKDSCYYLMNLVKSRTFATFDSDTAFVVRDHKGASERPNCA